MSAPTARWKPATPFFTALFLGLCLASAFAAAAPAAQAAPDGSDHLHAAQASADVRYAARWIRQRGDNSRLPFAIIDKKTASLYLFGADGRPKGATTVLLGLAIGDTAIPGIGQRDNASLLPQERTTPAGRFPSEPGLNLEGEDIVWMDYDARLAIHRLRPDAAQRRRVRSLASPAPEDKRMSLGCVVVPVAFYESAVRPLLGHSRSIVYVLPENQPVQSMFADSN